MSTASKIKSIQSQTPINYKKIYHDIIIIKYPEKLSECQYILNKEALSELDIIVLNKIIFGEGDSDTKKFNQMRRSYSKLAIKKILDYQKKYEFNNTQLAIHFKLSRNTVAKWKKIFL